MLDSVPLTTKPQQHPSIEDTSVSAVNAEASALTSAQTKNQKVTKRTRDDVTHAPLPSKSKRNDNLSPKAGVKGDKKKSRETKKVTGKRIRKEKQSSGDYIEDVSTTPHPTCGANLLHKQNTANAPKTNATNTAQGERAYTRKCLRETRAQQAC